MLDIGIPFYGQLDYLEGTIQSIKENTFYPYRLILVDDGTPKDDKWRRFINNFLNQEYVLYTLGKNYGVAYAFNEILNAWECFDDKYLCLLNSDVYCFKDWDKPLVDFLSTHDKVGCVGPYTNYASGKQGILPNNLPLPKAEAWWESERRERGQEQVPSVIGFCMMFSKSLFKEVGWFDERFCPAEFEETEWQWRASEAGYKHYLVKDSFVYHFGGKTLFNVRNRKEQREIFLRNCKLFERKKSGKIKGEVCHFEQ